MFKERIEALRNSTTARNGLLFTLFAFCNNGVNFILLIILAKYIEPGEYGQLNLFTTFIQLFNIFICLGTSGYIAVSFFKSSLEKLREVILGVLIVSSFMLLLNIIVLGFTAGTWQKIFGIDAEYQCIALFICYFQVFNTINLDIWRLEEQPIKYGFYSLSMVAFNFVVTLILVIGYHQGWLGRLYSQTAVAIVYFLISLFFLIKRGYLKFRRPSKQTFKELFAFGIPLVPHQASGWLKQGADRYIINFFLSVSTVGVYSFALNLSNIITIIGVSFNATNSVYIYKKLSSGYLNNKKQLEDHNRIMVLFFSIVTILIVIGSTSLIPLFVPKYDDSLIFILPLCLAALFGCFYTLYVNFLFFYSKTKGLMIITFTVSLLQVVCSYLLTRNGALWTAYIFMTSQLMTFLCVFFYSRRVLRQIVIKETNE